MIELSNLICENLFSQIISFDISIIYIFVKNNFVSTLNAMRSHIF